MPAVNLSSLSTFWDSIKSYFKSNSYESVVLYDGTDSKNVDLSESIDNFERIEVTWKFDSDTKVINEFVPSLTSSYFTVWSYWATIGGTSWLKFFTFGISANRTNFTGFKEINASLSYVSGTGSVIARNEVSNFKGISKVVGINRIANN